MTEGNLVIKTEKCASGLASKINYLKRCDNLFEYGSCNGIEPQEFIRLRKSKESTYYSLIFSPKKTVKVDFRAFAEKIVEGIKLYNHTTKLVYLYFVHKDTDTKHLHFLALDNPKPLDLSLSFCLHILRPFLCRFLSAFDGTEGFGERVEESIRNFGLSILDFEIQRCCKKENGTLVFSEEKMKKRNDEKKCGLIVERLKFLQSDLRMINTDNGRIEVKRNFIKQLVLLDKSLKHTEALKKAEISPLSVKGKYVSYGSIKKIISEIKDEENKTTSLIVENDSGEICYFARKQRSNIQDNIAKEK